VAAAERAVKQLLPLASASNGRSWRGYQLEESVGDESLIAPDLRFAHDLHGHGKWFMFRAYLLIAVTPRLSST
jgi:hypothetical protein